MLRMNGEESSDLNATKSKPNRKIYHIADFFKYYKCTAEIPEYLKDFQFLHNNSTQENWCTKPFPKFDEVTENKGKSTYTNNKTRVRQRTLSNQSGEFGLEYHEGFNRQRTFTNSGKFNRFANDVNSGEDVKTDLNSKFINSNDFQDNPESQWHKVEPRINRFNASKPYSQNIQVTENHWKKWTKDTNPVGDKAHRQQNSFNRPDKSSNNWSRKNENEIKRNTRVFGRHNVLKSGDQTEDIWQDDWDTEMRSEIAKDEGEIHFDSFEFSKSSLLSKSPPLQDEPKLVNSMLEQLVEPSITPNFDMWFYRDLERIERGPFKSEDMANWLATGYFNPLTFVRRMCDEKFLLLAEYRALYGRIPFTAGPAVPPILHNTPIELDPNQILIGVENNLRQQVMNCAVSLSHISHRIEDNLNVSPNAILEEKRLLDESRAELEREKERMLEEQIQWRLIVEADLRAKMNAELNAKLVEMQQTITAITGHQIPIGQQANPIEQLIHESDQPSVDVIKDISESVPQIQEIELSTVSLEQKMEPVIDKWEIDDSNIQHVLNKAEESNKWLYTKDGKIQKKNKKAKAKENKNAKEEKKIIPIPEVKPPEQPTDSRLVIVPRESLTNTKENGNSSKIRQIKIEVQNRKSDTSMRGMTKNTVSSPGNSTIREIQAEESNKLKKEKNLNETEIQGVRNTSPKETVKVEQVKSIWNAVPQAQKVPNQGKSSIDIDLETKWINDPAMKDSEKSMKGHQVKERENLKETQVKVDKSKNTEVEKIKNKQSDKISEKPIKNEKQASTKPSPVANKSFLEIQAEETLKENQAKEQQDTLKSLESLNTNISNKTETSVTWKSGISLSQNTPTVSKSLLEIQAEEALKEKRNRELEKAMKVNQMESNKVTSFKESLLKTAKPTTQIPVGKSIWDMLPTEIPANKAPEHKHQIQTHVPKVAQKETVATNKEIESDQLTKWCLKKLTKYSDRFELNTVIELLKEVPNEEVMEMAIQLLDDSKFTSSFVLEFINKRQELFDNQAGDTWQTVKKSISSPPTTVNNSKSKSGKSKSKKKMVLINTNAKFR